MSNPVMSLVPEPSTPQTATAMGASRRLAAIKVLRQHGLHIDTLIAAASKRHADALSERSKALNELIDQPEPPKKDAIDRLRAIKNARNDVEAQKKAKLAELDPLKALRKETEQAFIETIEAKVDGGTQLGLELGDRMELATGLELTPGTLSQISSAARTIIASSADGSAPDDVKDLALAIAGMDITGDALVTVSAGDVEEDDTEHAEEEYEEPEEGDEDLSF